MRTVEGLHQPVKVEGKVQQQSLSWAHNPQSENILPVCPILIPCLLPLAFPWLWCLLDSMIRIFNSLNRQKTSTQQAVESFLSGWTQGLAGGRMGQGRGRNQGGSRREKNFPILVLKQCKTSLAVRHNSILRGGRLQHLRQGAQINILVVWAQRKEGNLYISTKLIDTWLVYAFKRGKKTKITPRFRLLKQSWQQRCQQQQLRFDSQISVRDYKKKPEGNLGVTDKKMMSESSD